MKKPFLAFGLDAKVLKGRGQRTVYGFLNDDEARPTKIVLRDERAYIERREVGAAKPKRQRLGLPFANWLLDSCLYSLVFTAYEVGPWIVYVFEAPLAGLALVWSDPEQVAVLEASSWSGTIIPANGITVKDLARHSRDLTIRPSDEPLHTVVHPRLPRIALAGAPCSGKTTFLAECRDQYGDRGVFVPEVLTAMVKEAGLSVPYESPASDLRFIRELAGVRRGLERMADIRAQVDGKQFVMVDRGVLDSAAYVPWSVEELLAVIRSTDAAEYGAYDLVLFFELAPFEVWKDRWGDNEARHERGYAEVLRLERATKAVWERHPNIHLIRNADSWEDKSRLARMLLEGHLLLVN